MADEPIKAASYIFDKDGLLTHLEVDGKHFAADTLQEVGGKASLSGNKLTAAITKASESLPKDAPLSAAKFDALHGFAQSHASTFKGDQHPLAHIIETNPYAKAYKAASAKGANHGQLIDLLVAEAEHGAHLKHVPVEHVTEFRRAMEQTKEGSYAALKTNLKDGRAISEKLIGTDFTKDAFDKAGAIDKHIEGVLGGHHTADRPVSKLEGFISKEAHAHIANSGSSYSSVDTAIKGFDAKIAASEKFLTLKSEKLLQLQNKQKSFIPSRASSKASLAEEIKNLEGSIASHLDASAAHGVAYKNLPDHVRKTPDGSASIKTAGTKAASEIGQEAAKTGGAKWLTGGKWYGFTHTAETVGHEAGKIGKMRWGKAGIVGGLAVAGTYAVSHFAGAGSKGKYADQVVANQQQLDGQQAGVGIA